ncbi:MFS transporter, partial [Microbacteriaceae bacterium K1510]|nr:MFS transporter [Microbacteriaceae bacterium K1510]
SRAVSGVASASIIPLALALIGDEAPANARSLLISKVVLGILAGMSFGVAVGGLAAATLGWHWSFRISAFVSALAFAASLNLTANQPRRKLPDHAGTYAAQWRQLLRHPLAKLAFIGVVIDGAAIFGLTPHVAGILERSGA